MLSLRYITTKALTNLKLLVNTGAFGIFDYAADPVVLASHHLIRAKPQFLGGGAKEKVAVRSKKISGTPKRSTSPRIHLAVPHPEVI